jgi:hypothetical protein
MGWDGPVTHRQLIVWKEYFRLEMDRPSRTDFYLMRVAFEAFYSQRKYPNNIDLEPFRLKFTSPPPDAPSQGSTKGMTRDEASTAFKALFTTTLGLEEADVQENPAGDDQ